MNNMIFMDEQTKESLDFQYILNKIVVKTPYGQLYKDKMRAFTSGEEFKLIEELKKVEIFKTYAKDKVLIKEIHHIFHHIKDLRDSIKRARDGNILSEIELFEIKNLLYLMRNCHHLLEKHHICLWEDMKIQLIKDLERLLDPEDTGINTFYIYDSYSENLKRIREAKRKINKEIKTEKKYLKEKIEKQLNIKLRPDGTIIISKDHKELIKLIENYGYLTYTSETYLNIKYSLKPTNKILLLEKQYLSLKEEEEKEENIIRKTLSDKIGKSSKSIFKNMANIGKIDFILAKAVFAIDIKAVKPKITKDHIIKITEGHHPKIEEILNSKGLKFTPISIELKEGITCITGANMGGKTISLKLIGLLTAMTQYGLLVPAKSMELGLNQFIKTSIGDLQSTDKGLSTFGGEIRLIKEAIDIADRRGLILIDELAQGTNPEEGYAISKAIVEYLKKKNSITLLTTHYDNIGNIEGVEHLQVVGLSKTNINNLYKELKTNDSHILNKYMDYRLEKVELNSQLPRDGINIAKIMGLNEEIIKLAEENLEKRGR